MPPLCHYWRPFQALPTRHSVARKHQPARSIFVRSLIYFFGVYISTLSIFGHGVKGVVYKTLGELHASDGAY